MPFCPECGQQVNEDDQFCDSCGAALQKKGIPVPPPPPVPPPAGPLAPAPQHVLPSPGTPQPASPLPVRQKSAGLAALGSFFFSGLGQVYNGQAGKGVAVFLGTLVGVLLFLVPGIIIWIAGVADAWMTAKKMNEGKIPFREHSWPRIIAFFIFSFIVGYIVYSVVMMIAASMIEEGFSFS